MPPTDLVLAGVMVVALILYLVLGGADFGGGVWDLLASGRRRVQQRLLIEEAIGPIWEANHVWLILVVVLLFSAFPPAFAAVSIALHVPLVIFLVGIVFRGSAFTFRLYDSRGDRQQRRWGLMFSLASIIAPVLLGMCVGAIASGEIRLENGAVASGFFAPWLRPFPIAIGLFTLALCAFLAATYLAYEAEDPALKDDFRTRALAAGVAVGVLAGAGVWLSGDGAPIIRAGLVERSWSWPFHLATGVAAVSALIALWARRFALARYLVVLQAALIVIGWAASQYPYLLVPDLTLESAAANPAVRRLLLIVLVAGAPILLPSLYILFRIFKGQRAFAVLEKRR